MVARSWGWGGEWEIIKRDCSEQEILDVIASYRKKDPHQKVVILVTVIGGQGYIFGRGNQQISGRVIMAAGKENIIVAAARGKFNDLFGKPLYADTGDEEVNAYLRGYIRVIMGYELESVKKVTKGGGRRERREERERGGEREGRRGEREGRRGEGRRRQEEREGEIGRAHV